MNLSTERLKYITAVILYGTIGMFLRFVTVPSEVVALARGMIGSVFILLFLRFGNKRPDRAAIRANLPALVISGVMLGLNWIFLFAAYIETTVAVASLCNYMAPLIVIIVSPLVLKEKLDRRKLPCVAFAFLGIILVSGVLNGGTGNPKGVLYGLLAALCFTAIVISNRKMKDISPYDKSVIQLAISAVTILPYVIVNNMDTGIHPDLRSVIIILMLGIVHTGFAYVLYFSGMANLPVQTIAILGYLEPVVSVLGSAFFLHEKMSIAGWCGAVLILSSAVISEKLPSAP